MFSLFTSEADGALHHT